MNTSDMIEDIENAVDEADTAELVSIYNKIFNTSIKISEVIEDDLED